jgi:hypothetical protein
MMASSLRVKNELLVAQEYFVTAAKCIRRLQRIPADVRAIGAVQVLKDKLTVFAPDLAVKARNTFGLNDDFILRRATNTD